jgi:tRNA A-37 threonylcarbamoyl transferase component Bud32
VTGGACFALPSDVPLIPRHRRAAAVWALVAALFVALVSQLAAADEHRWPAEFRRSQGGIVMPGLSRPNVVLKPRAHRDPARAARGEFEWRAEGLPPGLPMRRIRYPGEAFVRTEILAPNGKVVASLRQHHDDPGKVAVRIGTDPAGHYALPKQELQLEGVVTVDRPDLKVFDGIGYKVTATLGEGGYGRVYLVKNTRGASYALKEIDFAQLNDVDRRAVADEANVHAGLVHPLIPRVHGQYTSGKKSYVLMDYVEGNTMDAYVHDGGRREPLRLSKDELRRVADDVTSALSYMHADGRKLIHRDVKPENLIMGTDGRVRLFDFGLARRQTGKGADDVIAGTPGYAPPEQALGLKEASPATDAYALGVTLFEVATGQSPRYERYRVPWTNYVAAVPDRYAMERTMINKGVAPDVRSAILRMVRPEPSERPQSMADVRALLGLPR